MMKTLILSTTALTLGINIAASAELSGMSWDDIVTQAKAEGELTWYVWYLQDDLRRAAKSFEDEYGIKVTIPEGTAAGNAEKLMAERGRETGDIDVFAWGYNDFETVDLTSQFTPLTMLPQDDGRVSELVGIDGGDYLLAYWGNQTGVAYDPTHVSEGELPQTPEEFAAFWSAHPEKFGFNYEKGGSGPSFYQNVLRTLTGVDFSDGEVTDTKLEKVSEGFGFFKENGENFVVTASNADSIIRVSDGELWMAPAWEDHLAGLQKRGEVRREIKFYIPEMGMNGGGNGVAIPKNSPHPAAAAVFVNWLTSAETQTMFNREFGTAPMHAKADDSHALVSNEQRKSRQAWAAQPFRKAVEESFVENVILER
ncbi:extracellular solute-binding protein [Roseibium marinum]|uniref:Putative spermidine/putrescine transport system substrate-binding protein n=1 Tax=Roseibium marinum TaxID=281252 RepID=A0A2S3USK4_9HYPH|nr:extracellular solute-binding protein [Roseibium marinum]POF30543.1 putative spermidine/putrescine transport system substrate-binding protein [Roseibium marinum]